MRSVVVAIVALSVGVFVGWMIPREAPAKPDQNSAELARLHQQVSQQQRDTYEQKQKQESDAAQAKWQEMWDDEQRDRDQRARERRAYQMGEADGEGYGESQARQSYRH